MLQLAIRMATDQGLVLGVDGYCANASRSISEGSDVSASAPIAYFDIGIA